MRRRLNRILFLMALFGLIISLGGCSKIQLRSKYDVSQGTLSEQGAVGKLISALDDPNSSVRAWAAVYLRVIGPDAQMAIPKLKHVVANDPDRRVKDRALRALGEIYPLKTEARQYFRNYLESSDDHKLKLTAKEVINKIESRMSAGTVKINISETEELAYFEFFPELLYDTGYSKNVNTVSRYEILPIRVDIENLSMFTISLDYEDFLLTLPGNIGTIKPMTAEKVIRKMEYSVGAGVANAILWGAINSPFKAAKANRLILNHTKEVSLSNEQINPYSRRSGYLFYEISSLEYNIEDYNMNYKLKLLENNDIYNVNYDFNREYNVTKIPYQGPPIEESLLDFEKKLISLKKMYEQGLISEEEYKNKRSLVIDSY